ncbi:endonuclease/exonuclease/phosphatase family protein [Spirosoma taeanense]|uniref:Endonuclease/exonuclease/phosphatase family protein n=1 Tax=Spirosoma taeanense TaxID=2735870 RepID=A0A6M5YBN7_9BACT|nr:endonuclease/exonuclease/phosphatase family protein [Spirosoma taeanense]QJW90671.1 endonuclease/exonuclease/phosphatase family protein [Spirosoma taeanense]
MRNVVQKISLYIGIVLIGITLLSLLYDTSLWFLQIFNFPRLQLLIALICCLVLYAGVKRKNRLDALVAGLAISAAIQTYYLFPYFPFTTKHILSADAVTLNRKNVFSLIVANVYMKNRNAAAFIKIVSDRKPTLVLTMEVDNWWMNHLDVLKKDYPYRITYPTDNTYGMALYSKLPLQDSATLFFNHDGVPSFLATVSLPTGASFRLLTVHPVAPRPSKHPDNLNSEEVGLLKAGRTAAAQTGPTVVAGDFNDVGWSYNTRRFEEISGLKDVRCGRGMYNTFDQHSVLMRWPLDYVYTSSQFRVAEIERLPAFGSDHFPLYVELVLGPK